MTHDDVADDVVLELDMIERTRHQKFKGLADRGAADVGMLAEYQGVMDRWHAEFTYPRFDRVFHIHRCRHCKNAVKTLLYVGYRLFLLKSTLLAQPGGLLLSQAGAVSLMESASFLYLDQADSVFPDNPVKIVETLMAADKADS